MDKLSKKVLTSKKFFLGNKEIGFHSENNPERILQFGEGNFLRAFVDLFVDELNEKGLFGGSVVIVPPIQATSHFADIINSQDGCYTVVLRGLENNAPTVKTKVVTSISRAIDIFKNYDEYMDAIKNPHLRFIVSNTTEAGIVYQETDKPSSNAKEPPKSFPAKIAALLYERYKIFGGAADRGFIFIPCELIDDNGKNLREAVIKHANDWGLPQDFLNWVAKHNHFTNTLVDRIVTGYPKDEAEEFNEKLGFKDDLLVTGEIFHFFAIEASEEVAKEISETFKFHEAEQNVVLTDDVTPYKVRKVRILNGAHTMSVLAAFLGGKNTVGEMMEDPVFVKYLRRGIFDEIIPSITASTASGKSAALGADDLTSFASSVFDRFANPYVKHYLLSIALNSVSKFKARVLPSILDYHKSTGEYPKALTFSFAALMAYYKGAGAKGRRDGGEYDIQDSQDVLEFFESAWQKNDANIVAKTVLGNKDFWDADLTKLPGFSDLVAKYLAGILKNGIKNEIEGLLND